MIKVCHITTVHPAFDDRIFYRECKTLVRAGYEVYLIVTHNGEEIIDGVHIIPLPERKGRFYRFFVKDWLALFKAIKVNARVYHFHDPELIFVGLILKLFRKKVIYDVHENVSLQISSKEWMPAMVRKGASTIAKWIEWFGLYFFDSIITAGKDIELQPHFKRFLYKVELIRNFPVVSINESITLNKSYDKIKFIYTGGLSPDRGILEIVEAAKLIKSSNFELTLLGSFKSPAFREKILVAISDNEKIKYISAVPYVEMFNILAKQHVGLICFKPTSNNIGALSGRNSKIYEYLEAGLAIIGSNFLSWQDFIEGNNIGIVVDPNDTQAIAKAMEFFIKDPEKLKIMGKNAKKLSSKYSWEAESKKLINLYKELLK